MNPKQNTIDLLDDLIKAAEASTREEVASTGEPAAFQSAKLKETSTHTTVDEGGDTNATPGPDGGKTTFEGRTGVQASPTGENVPSVAMAPGSDVKTASDLTKLASELLQSTEAVVKRASEYADTKSADEPSDEPVSEEKPKIKEEKATSDDSEDKDLSVEEKAAAYDKLVTERQRELGRAVGERTAALVKAANDENLTDIQKIAADQAVTARRSGEIAGEQLASFILGRKEDYAEKVAMSLEAMLGEGEELPGEMPVEMPIEDEIAAEDTGLDDETILALLQGLEEEGALSEELPAEAAAVDEVAPESAIEEAVEADPASEADGMAEDVTEDENTDEAIDVDEKIASLSPQAKLKLVEALKASLSSK